MSESYKLLLNSKSKDLLISFGSRGQSQVTSSNYLRDVQINQMHFFDRDGYSWYQQGVTGIADDIFSLASHIKELSKKYKFNKIYCIGASMGGYAALAVGALINAYKVIAISPQVILNHGWPLAPKDGVLICLPDVSDIVKEAKHTRFTIISSSELVDVYHVSKIIFLDNVNVSILKSPHNILSMFKKSFYLSCFLDNVLSIERMSDFGIKEINLTLDNEDLSDFLSLYFAQNYKSAYPFIKRIVLLNPDWLDAKKALADILFNLEDFVESYKFYSSLIEKGVYDTDIFFKLLYCVSFKGETSSLFDYYFEKFLFLNCIDNKNIENILLKLAAWATKRQNHYLSQYVRKILIDKYGLKNYSNYYQLGRSLQVLNANYDAILCYKRVIEFKDQFLKKDLWIYERALERLDSLNKKQ